MARAQKSKPVGDVRPRIASPEEHARLPWEKLKAQYLHNRPLIHAAVDGAADTIRQISEGELRWQIKEAVMQCEPLAGRELALVSMLEQELHRRGLIVSLASHLTRPAPGTPAG